MHLTMVTKEKMLYDVHEEDQDLEIDGLKFKLTCYACPEQYDVFKGDKQVAYIRLRWSHLKVHYPDIGGEIIYDFEFSENEMQGCFYTEKQRDFHLKEIAKRINEKLDLNFCAE